MKLPSAITELLGGRWTPISAIETFELGEWIFEGSLSNIPDSSFLEVLLGGLPTRDVLKLAVEIDGDPVTLISNRRDTIGTFVTDGRSQLKLAGAPANARLTIHVTKLVSDRVVSLYSISAFSATLKPKKFGERLATFSKVCGEAGGIWVQTFDDSHPFRTKTLFFDKTQPGALPDFVRGELLNKRRELCHSDYSRFKSAPDDFYITRQCSDSDLNEIFSSLCIGTSLTFLADVTWAETSERNESIGFKWNGYKVVTGSFAFTNASSHEVAMAWHSICEWVYSPSGVSDKMGLARNIMSLHWRDSIADLVSSGVLDSIRSSYEIYLRQNVRQYIETKNKLNDYLAEYAAKAAKLGEGLADKFEKNVTAFISFVITSIFAKILVDKTFNGVFNRPVALIGLLLVVGSVLHLVLTAYVFTKDRNRLEKEWDALKARYDDVLTHGDLNRIVEKTGGFQPIKKHLNSKRNLFIGVWIALIAFTLTVILAFADWSLPSGSEPGKAGTELRTNAVSRGP